MKKVKEAKELDAGQLRQGDVLLVRTAAVSSGAQEVAPSADRVVLKHGEATGHAHAFYERDRVSVKENSRQERHLKVVETAYLRHEEHLPATVPPGLYDLPAQTEWTDENEPRAVQD